MQPKIIHLTPDRYQISCWSGGTTTQIAITPEGALYAQRDFLWRLSSATVDLDESDFTPLPDYHRLIAPLRGEMRLCHNGGEPLVLAPYQVHAFDGGAETHSWGRCVDFNLMLRKGVCRGNMWPLRLTEQGQAEVFQGNMVPEPGATLLLYCAEGSGTIRIGQTELCLAQGEAVRMEHMDSSQITVDCPAAASFMAAQILT